MTDELFDDLARSLAQPLRRRSALRLLGGTFIAAMAPGLLPARARAVDDDPCPTCADRPNSRPCCVRFGNNLARVAVGQCFYPGVEQCCSGPSAYDGLPTAWICPKNQVCGADGSDLCVCADGRDDCNGLCCEVGEECRDGECKRECKNEHSRIDTHYYNPRTECCTDDGIEPKYPIRYFSRCEKTRVPKAGYKPTSNGCGPADGPKVPNGYRKASFLDACNKHDICYGTCKSDRHRCDDQFHRRMKRSCITTYAKGTRRRAACLDRAKDYYDAVTALGGFAYDDAQSEACQCCP